MSRYSRREFVALAASATSAVATGAAAPFVLSRETAAAGAAITAQAVVDRIKQQVGVDWKAETLDTFKAGDPATVVTGIVTTSSPTISVLERAVKAGANFVICCEPTFYGRADKPAPSARPAAGGGAAADAPPADPVRDAVFEAKNALIAKHKLVIWRFSDHWRMRKPDPFAQGLRDALGWSKFLAKPSSTASPSRFVAPSATALAEYGAADDAGRVTMPTIALDNLASSIKKSLGVRGGMRVMGDPRARLRTIGLLPGSTPIQAALRMLPGVDAIVAGEVREWETVEYVRDTLTAGRMKGLVLIGRLVSEDPGMKVCADWLNTIVPEVRATAIPAGDPYWRPRS